MTDELNNIILKVKEELLPVRHINPSTEDYVFQSIVSSKHGATSLFVSLVQSQLKHVRHLRNIPTYELYIAL